MKKFKVSYYWRTAGGDIDWETHEVEASNEEEAEEKIMEKLGRVKGFYKVKVEPINQFGRMQELAGVGGENDGNDDFTNTGYFEKGGPEGKYNVADCLKEIRYEAEMALEIGQGKQSGDDTDIVSKINRAMYFCKQALDLMGV